MKTQASKSHAGLDDTAYNLITILQNKAKGVHAYETYIRDAQRAGSAGCVELIERLYHEDLEHIEALKCQVIAALGGAKQPSNGEYKMTANLDEEERRSGGDPNLGLDRH